MCDIVSKLRAHLIHGHDGVLQHIMEQSCCNGFLIQLELGEYYGNTKRMYDIRLSRLTCLTLMGIISYPVGFVHKARVIRRMVLFDFLFKLIVKLLRARKILCSPYTAGI